MSRKSTASGLFKSFFPDPDNFHMMLSLADDEAAFEMACAFLAATRASEKTLRDGSCFICYLSGRCADAGGLPRAIQGKLTQSMRATATGGGNTPAPPYCPYYAAIYERLGVELEWCLVDLPSLRLPYVFITHKKSATPMREATMKVAITGPVDIIVE